MADKVYFDTFYISKCKEEDIITYVLKTVFSNKYRIETDKTKYSQIKSIMEHPFGTIKRSNHSR